MARTFKKVVAKGDLYHHLRRVITNQSATNSARRQMHVSDVKRALEDTILRPEENRIADINQRGTLAALDLWHPFQESAPSVGTSLALPADQTAATSNACSASSETVPGSTRSDRARVPPALCTSSSLDTIVHRHVARGASRRSSRALYHHTNKRKRSSSVSSCSKKDQSIVPTWRAETSKDADLESDVKWSLDSQSSQQSENLQNSVIVPEEDEMESPFSAVHPVQPHVLHQAHSFTSGGFQIDDQTRTNNFTQFRQTESCDDTMDCD